MTRQFKLFIGEEKIALKFSKDCIEFLESNDELIKSLSIKNDRI